MENLSSEPYLVTLALELPEVYRRYYIATHRLLTTARSATEGLAFSSKNVQALKTISKKACDFCIVNGRLAELKREKGVQEDIKIFFS